MGSWQQRLGRDQQGQCTGWVEVDDREWIRGSRELHHHEVAEGAAMLAGQSLANERHPHEAGKWAAALVAMVLAEERR